VKRCPSCGEENWDRAQFCQNCGTPLGEEAERPAETRKVVTIVFADVTGSTALGERLDPETLRRVMSRYFDEMAAVIERHGGTVEKFIGDAVMAVFGIPRLHEDDALRGVRASHDIRAALHALNANGDGSTRHPDMSHGVRYRLRMFTNRCLAAPRHRWPPGPGWRKGTRWPRSWSRPTRRPRVQTRTSTTPACNTRRR
jgi:class 3 adenylate cyclase